MVAMCLNGESSVQSQTSYVVIALRVVRTSLDPILSSPITIPSLQTISKLGFQIIDYKGSCDYNITVLVFFVIKNFHNFILLQSHSLAFVYGVQLLERWAHHDVQVLPLRKTRF